MFHTPRAARAVTPAHGSWVVVACLSGFLALSAAVALRVLDPFDRGVFEFVRPGDAWEQGQMRWVPVIEALRPDVVLAVLAATTVGVCIARGRVRPALITLTALGVAGGITLVEKWALARPDPHATGAGHGGSFPSGHTLAVVLCVGLTVHMLRPSARHAPWLLGSVAGAVMGTGLVVIGAHWATDVLGGALLALAVLSAATGGTSLSAVRRPPTRGTLDRAAAPRTEGSAPQL